MECLNMYRIVKLRNISLRSACTRNYVDHRSLILQRTCSLCNRSSSSELFPGYSHHVKEYSTSLIPAVHGAVVKKKKGSKAKKIVSDLLVVNNDSVLESRAKVMKLSARELSLFVEQPDLEPHQLKDKAFNQKGQTLSSLRPTSHISSTPSSVDPAFSSWTQPYDATKLSDRCNIQNFGDKRKSSTTNSDTGCDESSKDRTCDKPASKTKPKTKPKTKTKPKPKPEQEPGELKKREKAKLEKLLKWKEFVNSRQRQKVEARQTQILLNLKSYLDVCVNSGKLKEAYSAMHKYCKRDHSVTFSPISAFEVVFEGCAREGNLDTLKSLLNLAVTYRVVLSPASYAACLECLGRCKDSDTVELVQSLIEDMDVHGVKKEDLFTKCRYLDDSKKIVLEMIRLVDPGFSPVRSPPDMDYEVKLLKDLQLANRGRYQSPVTGILSAESVDSLIDKQTTTEHTGALSLRNINCLLDSEGEARNLKQQAKMETYWRKAIEDGLKRDLDINHRKRSLCKKAKFLHAFLEAVPVPDLVEIILLEVKLRINDSEMFSTRTRFLYFGLGAKVNKRYNVLKMIKNGKYDKTFSVYKQYCKWYCEPSKFSSGPDNPRKIWQTLEYENLDGSYPNEIYSSWPAHVLENVGSFLYKIIFKDVMIDRNHDKSSQKPHLIPAFYTIYRHVSFDHQEQLKIHPLLGKIYQPGGRSFLMMDAALLPMISPPKPWTSADSGGFLLTQTPLVRLHPLINVKTRGIIPDIVKKVPPKQIYGPLDALNQLGSIPWKVNCKVLDIMMGVFNSGGSPSLGIPSPAVTSSLDIHYRPEMTKAERREVTILRRKVHKESAGMYSQWCDVLYKLCLANHFRDHIIWLPHNMDFRGRVYPVAPHLHHMGSDVPRSLLVFAKGEKLGPSGLDWLKIHLVNLTGMKKQSTLDERLEFANEILPQIMESADDPLEGKRWWAESEEPWQTLAACMEITSAIRSGDPENFISHYPVHQDGSCNGLQHYAALGRDVDGAISVNLAPTERPADVYTCVLNLVEQQRVEDAKNGMEVAQKLETFMSRKLVKQTVMTTVYGVTRFGAILQMSGNLQDSDFPERDVLQAASYLAQLTFNSLTTMFTSTKNIQDWFTDVAHFISHKMGESVMWVTPIGLPIIQPYYNLNKMPDYEDKPPASFFKNHNFGKIIVSNTKKQKNAFPPNFIHSLDSSHMMLTALYCEQANVTFASVHDCFWTHASNVETMSKICREQFVKLHSEPILENLSASLLQQHCTSFKHMGEEREEVRAEFEHLVKNVPGKGTFNLHDVLKSKYFFS